MAPSLPSPRLTILAVPLTAESFAPFGTIITSPLPPSTTTIPTTPPSGTIHANQSTALKTPAVSPLTSTYHLSPSNTPANPTLSLFSCFPRPLRLSQKAQIFDVKILERHPYTTQTFIPLSAALPTNSKAIIIVAPTLPSPPPLSALTPYFPQSREGGPPDLTRLRAFVTGPGVGVTYGMGTWHAPMVVVGEGRVDWVVCQWVSGREGEDCQEVEIEEGLEVEIDDDLSMSKGEAGRSKL